MAAFTGRTLLLLLLTLAVVLTFSPCTVSISPHDYDSMTRVLRSHGYNLICNAMATSDLQYQLLTRPPNTSFTIFAPTDASLFALNMIQTASSYTDTLRLHVVPFRLSFFELRSIYNGSILPTLLPSTALLLSINDPLAVSGVEVVFLAFTTLAASPSTSPILMATPPHPYPSPITLLLLLPNNLSQPTNPQKSQLHHPDPYPYLNTNQPHQFLHPAAFSGFEGWR